MNIEQHYTTIVVGCGPAGIMGARAASERGPVLLIDTMKLPREKSCGGMLNEFSQAFIADELGTQIPENLLVDPEWIHFRYFDWDRDIREATTLKFANVDRKAFDEWLMGFLPDNVTVVDDLRLIHLSQTRDEVTVQLQAADDVDADVITVTCSYLLGADGPRSETRRQLPVSQLKLYKTLQDYLPLTGSVEPYFDCVYARGIGDDYGYGYVVPKGDHIILGSVFFPGSKHVNKLHEKAVDLYSAYYNYSTERTRREAWNAISVTSVADIAGGHGRVLLAGEAGGIFSPSSGEGISFALNSGTLAGRAIADAREGATLIGKRNHFSSEESEALRLYREALGPIRRNIERRLKFFPIMNSDIGKFLGAYVPPKIIDKFTHII